MSGVFIVFVALLQFPLVDTIVNISEGTGKVNENRPQKPHSSHLMN
jgi:hypothetical protein